MKLVIWPAVDADRLMHIQQAAGNCEVVNASSEEEAEAAITNADGFFGKLTPQLLSHAKQLRWVQSPTASLEHYVFPELTRHPCQLTNMRGLFSDVIADHVLGYVLCFVRNMHTYIRNQNEGRWQPVGGEETRASFATGPGHVTAIDREHFCLGDCTMGIIGVGAIGAEIARRANAFGTRILGVDPIRTSVDGVLPEILPTDRLDELLAESDFVVIAAPHTPETVKLFRKPQFEKMKSSAYLINIGRGVIVDLDDLTTALQTGVIKGAALDVCEVEPLPSDHPLWGMPNVIITPHIAAASVHVAKRHLETLLENVRRFVANEPLLNVVNKELWF
ncbi:D-2-hydroxyacid dehydrogenase [Thalassoroseus pseudoceratinae]|uniref:D-2-hydroxyacid dehydrogenase n=1 Tax=Thalassoroseus pseudoceratinae TaxID=2713176 RepID=UPI00142385BF|nr:D-2-hydroxyacid dehydrogenase [Thalassoroseus pseudoceratinae]